MTTHAHPTDPQATLTLFGWLALNEAGMIHVTTLLEQQRPDNAAQVRKVRYYLQQKFQEACDQG